MRKSEKSKKKRLASAKRGMKKFMREKRSRDDKHLRIERIKQQRVYKNRKLQELIDKLAGSNQTEVTA